MTVDGSPLDLPGEGEDSAVSDWSEFDPAVAWASQSLFGVRERRVVTLVAGEERRISGAFGSLDLGPREIAVDLPASRSPPPPRTAPCWWRRARGCPATEPDRGDARTVLRRRHRPAAAGLGPLRPAVAGGPGPRRGAVLQVLRKGDGPPSTSPASAARTSASFALSRDGTRLVAEVADGGRERLVVARVEREDSGRGPAVTAAGRIAAGDLGVGRIRDLAWRTPGSVAVLAAPTAGHRQVWSLQGRRLLGGRRVTTDAEVFRGPGRPAGHRRRSLGAPLYIRTRRRADVRARVQRPLGRRRPRAGPALADVRRLSRAPARVPRPAGRGRRPHPAASAGRPRGRGAPWRDVGRPARPAARLALRGLRAARAGRCAGLPRRAAPHGAVAGPPRARRGWRCRGGGGVRRRAEGPGQRAQGAPARSRWPGRSARVLARRGAAPCARCSEPSRRRRRCCWSRCRPAPAVVRRRGHDPVLRMARVAAARLRRHAGADAAVARLLRPAAGSRDQAGLDAAPARRQPRAARCAPGARRRAGRVAAGRGRRRRHHDRAPPRARPSARWRTPGSGGRASPRSRLPDGERPVPRSRARAKKRTLPYRIPPGRLASVYGVRPGPWLRRRWSWSAQVTRRQADASRRRNGPRKARPEPVSGRRSRCGLEVSPAPRSPSDTACPGEKAGSGRQAARVSAGGCGVEDQVGRTDSSRRPLGRRRVTSGNSHRKQSGGCRGHRGQEPACGADRAFRSHVEEKLARLEKHDHRVIRVEVEVDKERNPRLQDRAIRVELTAFSKGPVVRAEAAAEDKMAALDLAVDRMAAQMRRAADRRRVHRGRHTPGLGRPGAGRDRARAQRHDRRGHATAEHERHVGPDRGARRRPAGGPREEPPGRADDPGPGALRDGAGRATTSSSSWTRRASGRRWSTAAGATTTA